MNSQELSRIIKIAARNGFTCMRLNPNSVNNNFDIVISELSLYLDKQQDKEYITVSANKDDWSNAIDIKIDSFDKYFELKSFW